MNYQALARNWRPQTLDQVVGQTHTTQAIHHALSSKNIHHAYLFTGTRGVGKTSIGRILAKSINCQQGISPNPCGKCDACQGIVNGNYPDLIEIDAASRTKVEDTREVLDHIKFLPSSGRFKVYLIDEVHMLSGHSFNALLKTLEEPPPHVRFILATTDPQKLPETVISRCLHFHLNLMALPTLTDQVKHILNAESISFDEESIDLIATHANGSMRDALSLTDKMIHYCQGNLTIEKASQCLGTLPKDQVLNLLEQILQRSLPQSLDLCQSFVEKQVRWDLIIHDLTLILHEMIKIQSLHQTLPSKLGVLAKIADSETLQLIYQIAIKSLQELPYAPSSQVGFEMMIIRMIHFIPQTAELAIDTLAKLPSNQSTPLPKATIETTDLSTLLSNNPIQGLSRQIIEQSTLAQKEGSYILTVQSAVSGLLNTSQKEIIHDWLNKSTQSTTQLTFTITEEKQNSPNQQRLAERKQKESLTFEALKNNPDVQSILKSFETNLNETNVVTSE
ncbi:MAG TPA: DNA polymerase III subunit gamma/tau [Gammaproteobacteria bacterium]|nr:DNA polymerase III subunit gamma/tau [Gammaproteobacteria bacterium]